MRTVRNDLAGQMMARIVEVAQSATEEERQLVAAWQAKAMAHADNPVVEFHDITPTSAAIMFLEYNRFNREWDHEWSSELSHIMQVGSWRTTPQGYGLYGDDGSLGDGAHRLAAQAYSGTALRMSIYFGMRKEDVGTLDCGKNRTPADAAALAGVANANVKMQLLRAVWAYDIAAGHPVATSKYNVPAVAEQIKRHDTELSRALEIAQVSRHEAVEPVLSELAAARVAYLLVSHGWPEARAIERIDELLTQDFASDKAPLAVAHDHITKHRKPAGVIAGLKEIAVVIKGMLFAETRPTVTQRHIQEIKNAANNPPSPEYPLTTSISSAAE